MQTGVLAGLEYKYTPLSTGIMVEYDVTDGLDFLPCRYDNLVWMTAGDLTKAVHELVPLYNGEAPTSGDLLDQVTQAISDVLARHGVNTKVRYELHTRGINGPVDAILFVSDSVKPKVQQITLTGANLMTADEKTENTKRLIGDDYTATRVRESLANGLFFLYGNKGYLRVHVGEPEARLVENSQPPQVAVTVPVTEGAQYRVNAITWSGNAGMSTAELQKTVPLRAGDIADHGKLDLGLEAVQKNLKEHGYLGAKVVPMPSYNDAGHTVSYEIQVTEGDQFHMGKLQISGLDPLVLDKLQKAWKLQPGEPYNADYPPAFLRENNALINGNGQSRTVKILQSPTSDKVVNVTLQF